MVRQILCRQMRAVLFGKGGNFLRKFTAIEGFAVGFGDQLQRISLRRVTEDFPDARCTSFWRKAGAKAWLIFQFVISALPQMADQRRYRETVARIFNCRLCESRQRQRAEALGKGHPAGDSPRYGDRVPAQLRYGGFTCIKIRMPAGRRTA
ncbi:hypothetical protein D3C87_1487450 [compost metagenome]